MSRRVAAPPPPSAQVLRLEELGRALRARGAGVWMQPTVAHRGLGGPLLLTLGAAVASGALGLYAPRLGALGLLAIALSALRDAEGGLGWLRKSVPRSPGWLVEAELPPPAEGAALPEDAPTVIVYAPMPARGASPLGEPAATRILVAVPCTLALLLALAALVHAAWPSPALHQVALLTLAALGLSWLAAAAIAGAARPVRPDADPSTLVPALYTRLVGRPPAGVRVLLLIGADGATWYDDLDTWLRNRAHRYDRGRSVLLALQPGRGPLGVAATDGLLRPRPAPTQLLVALVAAGLPRRAGRTAALRARRLGLTAVGLHGAHPDPAQGADRVEVAVRCLARLLRPEPT